GGTGGDPSRERHHEQARRDDRVGVRGPLAAAVKVPVTAGDEPQCRKCRHASRKERETMANRGNSDGGEGFTWSTWGEDGSPDGTGEGRQQPSDEAQDKGMEDSAGEVD